MLSHLLNRKAHMLFLGSQFWSWVQTLSDTYIKFIFTFSVFSLFLVLFLQNLWVLEKIKKWAWIQTCLHTFSIFISEAKSWQKLGVRNFQRKHCIWNSDWCVCVCVCVCMLSCAWLFETPWTVAHHSTLSMEFSRQTYWSRLPFSPPGDPPDPGIETESLSSPALAGEFFTTRPPANAPH